MQRNFFTRVFTVSLTIFAMMFGSGNLMFPPYLGIVMGQYTWLGFLGFILSGVVLPMLGLLAITSFDGDYRQFFGRLGSPLDKLSIFLCMLAIGPVVIMPRIVMFSYEMLRPFMPLMISPLIFATAFATLVFLATFRPGKLLDIIGNFLSPLKILTLLLIVAAGIFWGTSPEQVTEMPFDLFMKAFIIGYQTLDVLATIFFGAIIVHSLTKYAAVEERMTIKDAVKVTAVSSIFAGLLLSAVYAGMMLLGAYHGHGLGELAPNYGEIFSAIVLRILGAWGGAFISVSVFIACFTTTVSLAAVVGEYVRDVAQQRISFAQAVAAILAICVFVAQFGLKQIVSFSLPLIVFFYPIIVVIVLCNLAYKMFGFKPIVVPVGLTTLVLVVQKLMQVWS